MILNSIDEYTTKVSNAKVAELNLSNVVEDICKEANSNNPAASRIRWKNEDDATLYKCFLGLINESNLKIDDFRKPWHEVLDRYLHVIRELVKLTQWRGTLKACSKRLQKMLTKDRFTYRESRKLK